MNVGLVLPLRSGDRISLEQRFEDGVRSMPVVQERLSTGGRVKPIRGMGPMSRKVGSTGGPGYLLVGDAAGFLDPFTGEGIYRALRGAEIAATVLESSVRSAAPNSLLNLTHYEVARRRAFAGKERATWVIQCGLRYPPLLQALCSRARTSSTALRDAGNVLGDIAQPSRLLRPTVMSALLWPP